jgi:tape measure domain-containing protein
VSVVANVAINVDSRNAVSKLRQVQQGAQATQRATTDLTTAITRQSGAFSKLQTGAAGAVRSLSGLRGALASIGAGALVAGMVRGAAAAEQLQLRLKLLSREYGETERVQQFVAQSAKTFGQSQVEAAAGVADVYARLRPLGTSLAEIETVYKGFNAVALASGTSAEAASGAFLQLSQALGSGRLQGDEFRSIAEQVPGILKLVANEMGVTVGQLKQLGSEGKITSDVLINALAKGFEENKGKISELLALSPAQRFKEFKDSTQALSNAMGSELLPAIVPVVKVATELLKVFGQLPGPMKTIIAAAIGLTAAFVALAPAISATIGLLGGLSLATLAAAGPWIALAAGVTAAAVALAGYRSESQKVGGAARGGGAAEVTAASKLLAQKDAQIAGLQGQRKTAGGQQRGSIDRSLATLRRERAQLQSDVKAGTAATPAATAANAMNTPVGSTVGGGGGRAAGGGGASKAADEAKRLAEELQRSVERGNDLFRQFSRQAVLLGTTSETERKRLQIQYEYQDRVREINELKDAEQKVNLMAVNDEIRRLQTLELQTEELKKQLEVFYELAGLSMGGMLPGGAGAFRTDVNLDPNDRAQQKIDEYKTKLTELQDPINMAQRGAQGIGDAFSSSFQGIITGTQTAQEALASFFQNIAKSFLDMATEIIAQMVIMYAFKQLLGLFGGGAGIAPSNNFSGAFSGTTASFNPSSVGMGLLPGRANGGPVSSGQTYMVGERGPELFVPGRSGTIVANDKMGGGTNVVVNVDAKGSSVEGDEQGANQLGRVISAAVQSELIKQQRPGGILAR